MAASIADSSIIPEDPDDCNVVGWDKSGFALRSGVAQAVLRGEIGSFFEGGERKTSLTSRRIHVSFSHMAEQKNTRLWAGSHQCRVGILERQDGRLIELLSLHLVLRMNHKAIISYFIISLIELAENLGASRTGKLL